MANYIQFVLVGEEQKSPNVFDSIMNNWNVERTTITTFDRDVKYDVVRIEQDKNIINLLIYFRGITYDMKITEQTYDNHKKIIIIIQNRKFTDEYDDFLEDLKIDTMNLIMSEWENSRCYWLVDTQSETLSQDIYIEINKLENKLRSFINMAMIDTFGVHWWERVSVAKFGKKYYSEKIYENKSNEYKKKFLKFKNIQDELLTLNSDDLSELMEIKITKWNYSEENWKNLEEKIKTREINGIISIYEEQQESQYILWDDLFSKYFNKGFLGQWSEFCKMRNHIAHNKLVDNSGIKTLKRLINTIDEQIITAQINFDKTCISQEAQEIFSEKQQEEWQKKYLAGIQLGVTEETSDQIRLGFKYTIESFFSDFSDTYKYQDGVELYTSEEIYSDLIRVPKKIFFKEAYGEKEMTLELIRDSVDETPGSISFLEILLTMPNSDKIIEKYIYENGELKLNDENKYVIKKENKYNNEGLQRLSTIIAEEIKENFLPQNNKLAELYDDSKIYEGLTCLTCGEEAILKEDYIDLQKNQCFLCKGLNFIHNCEICEELFNLELDGDNRKLCENCIGENSY